MSKNMTIPIIISLFIIDFCLFMLYMANQRKNESVIRATIIAAITINSLFVFSIFVMN